MSSITKAKIKAVFFRIIEGETSNAYDDLIDRAYDRLTELVGGRELSAHEAADCEYAAAALANYERSYEYASHEKLVMSETGGVRRSASGQPCAEAAKKLMEHAFAQLAGIIPDPEFIFRTMGAGSCG